MDAEWAWWEPGTHQAPYRFDFQEARSSPPLRYSHFSCCYDVKDDDNHDGSQYELRFATPQTSLSKSSSQELPVIDLSFDSEKAVTLASISNADLFVLQYFQQQVKEDRSRCVDDITYELNGFIRENFATLKDLCCSAIVRVSAESLEASDAAYKRMHQPVAKQKALPFHRLQEVMEIVRMHRLGQDLDLFSVYCMMRSCRELRTIALRIAQQRLRESRLFVIPYVDGCFLSGLSQFKRYDTEKDLPRTTIHYEYGRPVEYVRCEPVPLVPKENKSVSSCAIFLPNNRNAATVHWKCEELVMANLAEIMGDIAVREYAGQKLCVCWEPNKADTFSETPQMPIKLFEVHLETVLACGTHVRTMSQSRMTLKILKNEVIQKDDVTVQYSGRIQIVDVQVKLQALCRILALQLEPLIQQKYAMIEETRPLWDSERAYLSEVRAAMNV